jgi:16S rRNA (adenine1518-N6/adenine1519-N6)-dimethyltransferase
MEVRAKKQLGQNFLHDESVLEHIAESAHFTKEDFVVEIGAGTGVLTEVLAQRVKRVVAFEVDDDLMPILLKKFPLSSNVTIVQKDILQTQPQELWQSFHENVQEISYKVVANIPYYITAPIIRFLIELERQPKEMILMMQKEVAERLVAPKGSLSVLGVSVQYYAKVEFLFVVPKTAFHPVPQVESAVVRLTPYRAFERTHDALLFRLVRMGFAARRKTLVNTLSAGLHLSKSVVAQRLHLIEIAPTARAQELSLDDWEKLKEIF